MFKPKKKPKPVKPVYDGSIPLPDVKQELFCTIYTCNTTPRFFGHGQFSYAFAYGHQQRIDDIEALIAGPAKDRKKKSILELESEKKKILAMCGAHGSRLLISEKVRLRCNYLMDKMFTDEIMDRELVYVLQQRRDLPSKMVAWNSAAKLRQRIREKVDVAHTFEPISGINYVKPQPEQSK